MNVLVFGAAGFVGLNIAERLLGEGHDVIGFDLRPVHATLLDHFRSLTGHFTFVAGDITDAAAVAAVVTRGIEVVVLGAAVTAGPQREALDPSSILSINLMAHLPILAAARDAHVRRVINLSSAAAYGLSGDRFDVLSEDTPADPAGLYAITKLASEKVGARIAGHWGQDFVSLRLSGVFGPWEHDTGVRDTLSPHFQVLRELTAGRPAVLARPGVRDWIYAADVAEAVMAMAVAGPLPGKVYNVSPGQSWSVLDWGAALAQHFPGGLCRLAEPGELPTVDLHGPTDRAPMSADAILRDIGWQARFDLQASVQHLADWQRTNRGSHGFDKGSAP